MTIPYATDNLTCSIHVRCKYRSIKHTNGKNGNVLLGTSDMKYGPDISQNKQ